MKHSHKSPAEIYSQIKITIPDDLADQVLILIKAHTGRQNRITRRQLIDQIFGIPPDQVDLYNSTLDRWIRECITELQRQNPVCASSGLDGYWWPEGMDEINAYAAELESRATALRIKSQRLVHSARELFNQPPQMRLPGV